MEEIAHVRCYYQIVERLAEWYHDKRITVSIR